MRLPYLLLCLVLLASCTNTSEREFELIDETLAIQTGHTVADVGAGDGDFLTYLSQKAGSSGRVLATEVDVKLIATLKERVIDDALKNVTVVTASPTSTGLSPGCCDVIFMRNVYHHLTDPNPTTDDLYAALKPDGRMLLIDFAPDNPLWSEVDGVPEDRGGHGIPINILIKEVTDKGFVHTRTVEDWPGQASLFIGYYGAVFTKPEE